MAVACLHRGIPFTLYERDANFNARSGGYGLTLQQASKALKSFGINHLKNGVVSTRHLVHHTTGEVIGEWGMRKWRNKNIQKPLRRSNIHIGRQSLRKALLEQLGGETQVQWGHKLIEIQEKNSQEIQLHFLVNNKVKEVKSSLVIGADGIRSTVRNWLIGEPTTPLRYLNCMVILGICPLKNLKGLKSSLLDGATVFQTANGTARIYMMPYDTHTIMWQLSFPTTEIAAKTLSGLGADALLKKARLVAQWHAPIPQILAATHASQVSGYPVYDRALLTAAMLQKGNKTTLIGDAAHPMSPFKGQGANQALLDALVLARAVVKGCNPKSQWRSKGVRASALNQYETEMLNRSTPKVIDSAKAAAFLHTKEVLYKADAPRGSHLKNN